MVRSIRGQRQKLEPQWFAGNLALRLISAPRDPHQNLRREFLSRAGNTGNSRHWNLAYSWVSYSIHGPPAPQLKIPLFGSQRPRDPKNRIPRVRFMKIRPGGRSGDLNRTDLRPYLGLAHVCSSLPRNAVTAAVFFHFPQFPSTIYSKSTRLHPFFSAIFA